MKARRKKKIFDVAVTETFNRHFTVVAYDAEEAYEIAHCKCNSGEFDATMGDCEFGRNIETTAVG